MGEGGGEGGSRGKSRLAEAARALAGLAAVLGASVAGLALLDAAPSWIAGEPAGVRSVPTLQDAERIVRARLVLPSYFPSTLRWPPDRVRVASRPRGAVALTFGPSVGEGAALVVAQTTADDGPLPEDVLAPGRALGERPIEMPEGPGRLARVVCDGAVWNEVSWSGGGRRFVVRSPGPVDELVKIARSARRPAR